MKLSKLFSECIGIGYSAADGTVNYALRKNGRELFLYFEASSGSRDWISNLNFFPKSYAYPGETPKYAHRGFLGEWEKLIPCLADAISDKSVKNATVVGYSHGAALAVLCHEYIWYHRPDMRMSLAGFGFGCPRVLKGPIPTDIAKRWERFTVIRNIDDIVTHLPPAILGFTHVGNTVEVGTPGKYGRIRAHYADNILSELIAYERRTRLADGRGVIRTKPLPQA